MKKVTEKELNIKVQNNQKRTNNTNNIKQQQIITTKYDISFNLFDIFNEFKIKRTIRDDYLLSTVYEIENKSNTNQKYYAEITKDDLIIDMIKFTKLPNTFKNYIKKANHGAIANYVGIGSIPIGNEEKPSCLIHYYPNGSLDKLLDIDNYSFSLNTYMQIILYGIASGMAYLARGNLLKNNILLNEYLFPKIGFYYNLDDVDDYYANDSNRFRGRLNENILDSSRDEKKEVFLFSLILYEIVLKKKPFEMVTVKIAKDFLQGYRPPIDEYIPSSFKNLIENCWSVDISKRPSFKDISELLKKPEFILSDVDTDLYNEYIRMIDEYQKEVKYKTSFSVSFEDFVSQKSDKFKLVDITPFTKESTENYDNLDSSNIDYFNLSGFTKLNKIGQGLYGEVYRVKNKKENDRIYAAKVSRKIIFVHDVHKSNIYREASILSQLSHPCILKFVGFSKFDFDDVEKPVIITEYNSNGSLEQLFELERNEVEIEEWDNTKKLMCIYGLASCMSFFHRVGFIHRDLKPGNILLDDYLFPKLANFCYTKKIDDKSVDSTGEIIGMPKYLAPEVFEKEEYSKSSDVYAFSMILFEFLSGEKPFHGNTIYQIMDNVVKGNRPNLEKSTIPKCFHHLIESCWCQNPSERISFDQIVQELRTNKEFVNNDVDLEVYQHYIKYLDAYMTNNELQIEDFFSKIGKSFEKVDIVSIKKEKLKQRKIDFEINKIPLKYCSMQGKIGEGSFGIIYKVQFSIDDGTYAAKVSKLQLNEMEEDEFISLYREVNILSKINHPCILKFIGYSETDFEHQNNPVVITEYSSIGTLDRVIKFERQGLSDSKWNNTTKLINIYGIALGMSYLHGKNIIHRDLKPDNILLDDNLYPKIADFGLSKEINESDKTVLNPGYKLKGTPIYCSPEIITSSNYTKSGDVYAFGFILYEIITNEVPYQLIDFFSLLRKIINNERPKFSYDTPSCFRELIEKCWSQDMDERPSFDEIVDELENNEMYRENDVDEDVFFDYIESIKGIGCLDHKEKDSREKVQTKVKNKDKQNEDVKNKDKRNEDVKNKDKQNEDVKNKIKEENSGNDSNLDNKSDASDENNSNDEGEEIKIIEDKKSKRNKRSQKGKKSKGKDCLIS